MKSSRVLKSSVFTGIVLLASISTMANEAKVELQRKLAGFDGFNAKFSQTVTDFEGKLVQESQGELTVKRPNFIHWNTTIPDENLIVSDGETLWYYEPFVEQVTAYSLDDAVSNTPLLLISNPKSEQWQNYSVKKKENGSYIIEVKDEESQVRSLLLNFKNNVIENFTVVDSTNQQSVFALSNVKTNDLPEKEYFQFAMPEDAILDDQRNQ